MSPSPQYATYPSLSNKTVLVTGGAEGIGASTITAFASQGSRTIILDISSDSAHNLIETIRSSSSSPPQHVPVFYKCDVTDLKALQSTVDQILKKFGRVDVLVNNAASAGGLARQGTEEVEEEGWEFGVNVNLRHQFFLTKWLVPGMMERNGGKGGSVINMGSISWRIPSVGLPVYATCKAAIVGLTKTHAREFGKEGIRVNSVMPGSIATERQIREVLTEEYKAETIAAQALKRVLVPDEVARVILFLASDDSSAVTGSNYVVDGGWVSDM